MKERNWWWISAAVSAVLIMVLIQLWVQINENAVEPTQLLNEQATTDYLNEH